MAVFEIEFDGVVVTADEKQMSTDDLDALTDKLMEKLLEVEDAIDPDVGATLSRGELRIRLSVEADQPPEAHQKAFDLVEKAFSALKLRVEQKPPDGRPSQGHWAIVKDHGWHILPGVGRRVTGV